MNIRDFYCSRCSLQFDKKSVFDMHLSIVHKERMEIKEDQRIFKKEPNLYLKKDMLMCDICELNFETQILLDQHVTLQNGVKGQFRCEICDHGFSKKWNLKRHIETVHDECEICEYSCSRKSNLKQHIKLQHTAKKSFKCSS